MKNPNSPLRRLGNKFKERWWGEDLPRGEKRFQPILLLKDLFVFVILPLFFLAMVKACEGRASSPKRGESARSKSDPQRLDGSKSQIIQFAPVISTSAHGGLGSRQGTYSIGAPRRSPGSLVRVKLLNVVETYSTAPVHAQITDGSLGDRLKGGTLIGDATPDSTFERISINFRFARDPNRDGVAVPITARALSLDGTLGLEADKKEGFIARSAIGSAAIGSQDLQKDQAPVTDLQGLLLRALTAGLFQELGTSTQVARNRAQVLKLPPQTEFFAELTDFFPGGSK